MKTYILNMTLSSPKNIEESEILTKLVQFAEDNNYLLGGGLQLVDEINPKDHCNYSDLPSPSAYDKTNVEEEVICPNCDNKENFHFNYDYNDVNLPIIDILCNTCGTFFKIN